MPKRRKTSKAKMKAPESGVTVRMYNPGFGDCLLLAFSAKDGSARYMLIDCGVHHLYPNQKQRMKNIARDIAAATGKNLDIVVVTHEHTDHLYGFKYAREIFDNIEIDELWLAWTEDPTNTIAKELKQRYGMRIRALNMAVNQLNRAKDSLGVVLQKLPDYEIPRELFSAYGGKADQLEYLRKKSKKKLLRSDDYRHPGETLSMPDVEGIKIYVLGPPTDVKWIRSLKRKSELYPEITDMNELNSFSAAALAASGSKMDDDEKLFKRSCPFEESFGTSKKKARKSDFFQEYYGFSKRKKQGAEWRRIETDWLRTAEQLALDINSKTNNTSLVLAIELTESHPRKVLLFAADAQVGNWLSWHEIEWPDGGEDGGTMKTNDLLRRTVLYKVGHHGSQNATLSRKGLEIMESDELVAMIPVDEEWATEKMEWKHPAKKLLGCLKEKTKGRIIRTDEIPTKKPPKKASEATKNEWKSFIKQLDWDRSRDKLWIQYTIKE